MQSDLQLITASAQPSRILDYMRSPAVRAVVACILIPAPLFVGIVFSNLLFAQVNAASLVFVLVGIVPTVFVALIGSRLDPITRQKMRWKITEFTVQWDIEDPDGRVALKTEEIIASSLVDNNDIWIQLSWGQGEKGKYVVRDGSIIDQAMTDRDSVQRTIRFNRKYNKDDTARFHGEETLIDSFTDSQEWVTTKSTSSDIALLKMEVRFHKDAHIANPVLEYYHLGMRHTNDLNIDIMPDGSKRIAIAIERVRVRDAYTITWDWNRSQKIDDT